MKRKFILFIISCVHIYGYTNLSAQAPETLKHGLGDNTSEEEYQKIPRLATFATRDLTDLPSSFSIKKYAPPVKDQHQYSTCVAWSSAYAARTISYAVQRNFTSQDSIIKYSFSPGYLYAQIKRSNDLNCMGGAKIPTAMDVMKASGNLLNSENLPDCTPAVANSGALSKAAAFKIKDYVTLSSFGFIGTPEIEKAKKSISEKKPVIFMMKCYPSFENVHADGFWNPAAYEATDGNHAMCIVGYDDKKASGAFEVMNSWGTGWGNKGFFWLTYNQLSMYGLGMSQLMDSEAGIKLGEEKKAPELSGNIEFVKLDQSTMAVTRSKINTRSISVEDDNQAEYSKYKMTEVYPGGTPFKIKFTTNAPAFIYIFSQDDKGAFSRLFPYNNTISAAINSNNATVFLPAEDKHARLSNTPGKENICVLYSKQPIDYNGLVNSISNNTSITQAIKDKFEKQLVPVSQIKFADDRINFKAPADDNKMICFFIELEHN